MVGNVVEASVVAEVLLVTVLAVAEVAAAVLVVMRIWW